MNKEVAWQEMQQAWWPEGTSKFLSLCSLTGQGWQQAQIRGVKV